MPDLEPELPPAAAMPAADPTLPAAAAAGPSRPRFRWRPLGAALGAGLLLALALMTFLSSRGGAYVLQAWDLPALAAAEEGALAAGEKEKLERRLRAQSPQGTYVLVDTYANRLRVMRDGEVVREAVCSTGSGTVLREPESGREWVFDTPLGERRVQRKVRNPVWVKPDWAFIEEGYAPPPMGSDERYDRVSLGDFGLYLGEGYIIHGTLFQSLLGQPVTHGCIRLGDEDLKYVYQKVPLGGRVYLY